MRAFLAIDISDAIRKHLKTVIKTIATHVDGVRWIDEQGQHITLKFFGEIDECLARQIKESIGHMGNKYGPFAASIKGVAAFPDRRRARVVVVTLENGVDKIINIYNDIEESLSALGIEGEKRTFVPHITLGRRKVPAPLIDKALVNLEGMSFNVESVVLFRSTLRPEGAVYTPVWEVELKGSE